MPAAFGVISGTDSGRPCGDEFWQEQVDKELLGARGTGRSSGKQPCNPNSHPAATNTIYWRAFSLLNTYYASPS